MKALTFGATCGIIEAVKAETLWLGGHLNGSGCFSSSRKGAHLLLPSARRGGDGMTLSELLALLTLLILFADYITKNKRLYKRKIQ